MAEHSQAPVAQLARVRRDAGQARHQRQRRAARRSGDRRSKARDCGRGRGSRRSRRHSRCARRSARKTASRFQNLRSHARSRSRARAGRRQGGRSSPTSAELLPRDVHALVLAVQAGQRRGDGERGQDRQDCVPGHPPHVAPTPPGVPKPSRPDYARPQITDHITVCENRSQGPPARRGCGQALKSRPFLFRDPLTPFRSAAPSAPSTAPPRNGSRAAPRAFPGRASSRPDG